MQLRIFFVLFQGSIEAYGTHAELVAQGCDPTQLMGIEKDERDEFVYDRASVEEEEGGEGKG